MDEFCPICLKKGKKSKKVFLQISFTEAQLHCEDEECIYPFTKDYIDEFVRTDFGNGWKYSSEEQSPVSETNISAPEDFLSTFADNVLQNDAVPKNRRTCHAPEDVLNTFSHSKEAISEEERNGVIKFPTLEYDVNLFTNTKDTITAKIGVPPVAGEILQQYNENLNYLTQTNRSEESQARLPESLNQNCLGIVTQLSAKTGIMYSEEHVQQTMKIENNVGNESLSCVKVTGTKYMDTPHNTAENNALISGQSDNAFKDICSSVDDFNTLEISLNDYLPLSKPLFKKIDNVVQSEDTDSNICKMIIPDLSQTISPTLTSRNKTVVVKCTENIPLPGWSKLGEHVVSVEISKPETCGQTINSYHQKKHDLNENIHLLALEDHRYYVKQNEMPKKDVVEHFVGEFEQGSSNSKVSPTSIENTLLHDAKHLNTHVENSISHNSECMYTPSVKTKFPGFVFNKREEETEVSEKKKEDFKTALKKGRCLKKKHILPRTKNK